MSAKIDFENLSESEKIIVEKVNKIGGHLLDTEIIALYRIAGNLAAGSKILEIGSYRGKSANAMGYAISNTDKLLYCLDIWRKYNQQPTGPLQTDKTREQIEQTDIGIFNDFLNNTDWFSKNLRVLKGSTEEFSDFLPKNYFDMVFIDGAHDYKNVCFDVKTGFEITRPGGFICGHDYHEGVGGEDIKMAINELVFDSPNVKEYNLLPGTTIWIAVVK